MSRTNLKKYAVGRILGLDTSSSVNRRFGNQRRRLRGRKRISQFIGLPL